jgi:hypothetical protein
MRVSKQLSIVLRIQNVSRDNNHRDDRLPFELQLYLQH